MTASLLRYLVLSLALTAIFAGAEVPGIISHQGRVAVGGASFTGTGQFRFALVNAAATTSYWSNDGTSSGGSEPTAAVALAVARGVFSVNLGDTSLANMTVAIPAAVFSTNSTVYLRVWFNDGTTGSQRLSPDCRITSVGYALTANSIAATNLSVAGPITASDFVVSATNLWDDLRFPPQALNPVGLTEAAKLSSAWGPNSNKLSLTFEDGQIQCFFANVQLPHDYLTNTTVFPHFHFSPNNNTASGNLVFKTSYTWANMGQTFGPETLVTNVIAIASGIQWKHLMVTAPTGGIAPPSNAGNFSSMIIMRVERLGNDSADTYPATIDMLEYDVHYLSRGMPVPFNH